MLNPNTILNASLLIVDDREANILMLRRMLDGAGYVSIMSTTDPGEVCGLHRKYHFDLILLDLLMPGIDGFQVMDDLKEIEPDGYLPVLVITAQPDHKLRALRAGAMDFISKPFELAEVLARVHNLLEARLLHKELQEHNEVLEQRVRERIADLQEGSLETVYTMMRAAEFKDEGIAPHLKRISYHSHTLAGLLGLDDQFVDRIFFASPMHDVGKIGIPDSILLKEDGLTPDEWEVMKGHTTMGSIILGNSRSPYLRMGAEIALSHHENWAGGGYPDGKQGEAIPLSARIMKICDVYDALRSKRPYKPAFGHMTAMDVIARGDARTQPEHFDPAILEVFKHHHKLFGEIFEEYTAKT